MINDTLERRKVARDGNPKVMIYQRFTDIAEMARSGTPNQKGAGDFTQVWTSRLKAGSPHSRSDGAGRLEPGTVTDQGVRLVQPFVPQADGLQSSPFQRFKIASNSGRIA